jgi:hypothetical protein
MRSASNLLPTGGTRPVSRTRCATSGRDYVNSVEVEGLARRGLAESSHLEPAIYGLGIGEHALDVVTPPGSELPALVQELSQYHKPELCVGMGRVGRDEVRETGLGRSGPASAGSGNLGSDASIRQRPSAVADALRVRR